jgi:hypothetical protein
MTLGTGIFSSTVLVLLAIAIWQITARHKWKLAGKIAAGFVAVCAAIGGGYYGWNYVHNLPPPPEPLHVVTELGGVKLGMSPTDVTLALGKPDTADEPTIDGAKTRINYTYESPELSIAFYGPNKYATKAAIICTAEPSVKLLGFDNFSNEKLILKRLGEPDFTSIDSDGLWKAISYAKWKTSFHLTKGFVAYKCILQSGFWAYKNELFSPEAQKAADQKAAAEAKRIAEAQSTATQSTAQRGSWKNDPIVANADPCAPDLSRRERLRRLAAFGVVQQTGSGSYTAAGRTVEFLYGGELRRCFSF